MLLFAIRLQVMDKHLNLLAQQHIETRFVKIHAEKSPFLAEKLKIVVLPTLALIKNAKVDDYVVCVYTRVVICVCQEYCAG